jgi:AcrR family transcriptional regulator
MTDAELTNGAFYAHFSSKDELVATVIEDSLREQSRRFEDPTGASLPVATVIDLYLSEEHRDDRAHGCPSAAFIDEIVRGSPAMREAYDEGLDGLVAVLARSIRAADPLLDEDAASARAQDLFAFMLGALQLARAVAEGERSRRLLERSRRRARTIAGSALPGEDPRSDHEEDGR